MKYHKNIIIGSGRLLDGALIKLNDNAIGPSTVEFIPPWIPYSKSNLSSTDIYNKHLNSVVGPNPPSQHTKTKEEIKYLL